MAHADPIALQTYMSRFVNLHRANGGAPHKPILLLAVLDEIERGHIKDNLVRLAPELVAAFREHWRLLAPPGWHEKIALPFKHLNYERFWELVKGDSQVLAADLGNTASISQLQILIDGARLAPDLWHLLQDATARAVLRKALIDRYFPDCPDQDAVQLDDPLEAEVRQLIANAQAKFRIRPQKTAEDDGTFMRQALFPRVVKRLYDHTCAVCRIRARTSNSSLVEAAHILPFAEFHNDDPRNGLALCPNHHNGFDLGWFGIADDLTILVSPRLEDQEAYVPPGTRLMLPVRDGLQPAREALRWHRDKWQLSHS